jgi:hypothetical protein
VDAEDILGMWSRDKAAEHKVTDFALPKRADCLSFNLYRLKNFSPVSSESPYYSHTVLYDQRMRCIRSAYGVYKGKFSQVRNQVRTPGTKSGGTPFI